MISVVIDEQSYKAMQDTLKRLRKELPKAAVSVMSKSLTRVKQILVDETYAVINLTKSRITEDVTTEISGNIASENLSGFRAIVRSTGKPVGLINFASPKDWAWQNPTNIRVKIFRNGQTTTFKHAFIAPGRSSRTLHMWQREALWKKPYNPRMAYWRMPHAYRYPLKRMTTIRIQDEQAKPEMTGKIMAQGASIVIKDLDGAITGVLDNG